MNDQPPRCANCAFFIYGPVREDLSRLTFCRRYPPEIMLRPSPVGMSVVAQLRPSHEAHWCGEWQEGEPDKQDGRAVQIAEG